MFFGVLLGINLQKMQIPPSKTQWRNPVLLNLLCDNGSLRFYASTSVGAFFILYENREKIMSLRREQLQKTSVLRLREIGRAYGVKAPTSLTKDNLINAILDIESGKTQPCPNSNRGRPTLSTPSVPPKTPDEDDVTKQTIPPNVSLEKLLKIQEVILTCEKQILEILLK